MDKASARRQKKLSQKQEQKVASDVGGRIVAGSGAAKFSGGGDVRDRGNIRVECKYTEKPFFILQLSDLLKIKKQAIQGGLEEPVMQVSFLVRGGLSEDFAIVPTLDQEAGMYPALYTDRKRIKLQKADVQAHLVRFGKMAVSFRHQEEMYSFKILRWADYLQIRGQED
jgi:hypothetical protein